MKALTADFHKVHEWLTIELSKAPVVHVGEWQAIRSGLPQEQTIELEDVSFEIPLPGYSDAPKIALQLQIQPNLPWAEDHFLERVSGIPHNPPPSHEWWPFAQKNNEQHVDENIQFSHTYPERFWSTGIEGFTGIRFAVGDLQDLVQVLKVRPGSRQAYLPIWFPEDIYAAGIGERVPCTLGYHFLIRNGQLKIVYYIRSCDFYRHFNDDVYMAGRLAQWVAERVGVHAMKLVMHISSLHIFSVEKGKVDQEAKNIIARNMIRVL